MTENTFCAKRCATSSRIPSTAGRSIRSCRRRRPSIPGPLNAFVQDTLRGPTLASDAVLRPEEGRPPA
jgi:hypothetical protein